MRRPLKPVKRRTGQPQKRTRRLVRKVGWILFNILILMLLFITSFRWINPPTTSALIQENVHQKRWDKDNIIGFEWRDWQDIAQVMPLAVIAAEDQRFPSHHGIDFTELARAYRERQRRIRGASTITQQVVKNMFLWSGRSYVRKGLEAAIALYIDKVWGKQRILEIYLNIVQFGPNLYGVENASQTFFKKSAKQINRFEAARLAVVLPNPNTRSAQHASEYVLSRQQFILKQMNSLGGVKILQRL